MEILYTTTNNLTLSRDPNQFFIFFFRFRLLKINAETGYKKRSDA